MFNDPIQTWFPFVHRGLGILCTLAGTPRRKPCTTLQPDSRLCGDLTLASFYNQKVSNTLVLEA